MDLIENIREALRSIRSNLLRSTLTALIIAIGIMALVGMLTAVDAIKASVSESLSALGSNSFDVFTHRNFDRRKRGVSEKAYPKLSLSEANAFVNGYTYPQATVALYARVTDLAEVKNNSIKTNPNVNVVGANVDYLACKGLQISKGRNFSPFEILNGNKVAVMGYELAKNLFSQNENPLQSSVVFRGTKFTIVGVLKQMGSIGGEDNSDNQLIIPIIAANQLAAGRGLSYRLTVIVPQHDQVEMAMAEATQLMRRIRRDPIQKPASFEVTRSESLAQRLDGIITGLQLGGIGVGFVTLLGAAVALMNIMMVSVTERTREVGVRKALGATPTIIRRQFIIEAITVCVLGGMAGILLGILIGNIISKAIGFNVFTVPWLWMCVGFFVCIAVGLLAGYYPAAKASKLDPIESLRFE